MPSRPEFKEKFYTTLLAWTTKLKTSELPEWLQQRLVGCMECFRMEMNTNKKVTRYMQLPDVDNPDKNNPDYWAPSTKKDDRLVWLETFISNIPSNMDEVIDSITTRLPMLKTSPSTVLDFQTVLKILMNRMIETSIPKQGSVTKEFVDEMTEIINNSIKVCSDDYFRDIILPPLSPPPLLPKTDTIPPQQLPSSLPLCTTVDNTSTIFFIALMFLSFL